MDPLWKHVRKNTAFLHPEVIKNRPIDLDYPTEIFSSPLLISERSAFKQISKEMNQLKTSITVLSIFANDMDIDKNKLGDVDELKKKVNELISESNNDLLSPK